METPLGLVTTELPAAGDTSCPTQNEAMTPIPQSRPDTSEHAPQRAAAEGVSTFC